MPCSPITDSSGKRRIGFICCSHVHYLGRGIWMEWHSYLGPTFFSDKNCQKWIEDWYERPRIVDAFEKWQKDNLDA